MSIQNGYQYNFNTDGSSVSGNLAFAGAGTSSSVLLPVGIENLLLVTTSNCHFRLSIGASTAVTTDPLVMVQQGPIVVKLPNSSVAYTLSAVRDTADGSLNYVKVAEA